MSRGGSITVMSGRVLLGRFALPFRNSYLVLFAGHGFVLLLLRAGHCITMSVFFFYGSMV